MSVDRACGLVGVLAVLAAGLALPQEVPALVELGLDLLASLLPLRGHLVVAREAVLLVDEGGDPGKDVAVVHRPSMASTRRRVPRSLARIVGGVTDIPTHELNDGTRLPAIGFGTYPMKGQECVDGVHSRPRGRLPADRHRGELRQRGRGRRGDPHLRRAARRDHRDQQAARPPPRVRRRARQHRASSLERLGLDYLDLHLIHWPNPRVDKYAEAWRALVDLREEGLVRSVGVSNFTEAHLDADHRRDRRDAGRSTRSSCTPTSRRPRCARSTSGWASAPSRGARSASGRRRSPSRRSPPPPRRTASTPGQVILRWQVQLGVGPDPEVGLARASAAEPRRLRVRAHRRRDGRDHGAGPARRAPVRRRPGPARGDVARPCAPLRHDLASGQDRPARGMSTAHGPAVP